MELKDTELFAQAIDFLKDCKGKRVHIIHDYDADGIGSGLLLRRTLERLGAQVTSSFVKGRGLSLQPEALAGIKRRIDPQRVIITDQDLKSFGAYEHYQQHFYVPTLIIDHHHIQEYEDLLFVHPGLLYGVDGANYCTSKLTYDLCADLTETEDLAWLAVVGVIGDMNAKHFPGFLEQTAEHDGVELTNDVFQSQYGSILEAIDCANALGNQELQDYVKQLIDCESLADALKLGNPYPQVKQEVDALVEDARGRLAPEGPSFIHIDPKHSIGGWAINILSQEHPGRIIFFVRPEAEGYAVSGRYQKAQQAGTHLGEIMRPIASRLGGKAGGHAPAAGGWVPEDRIEEFERAVTEALKKDLAS